jgi:hypothetical protein
MLCLLLCLLTWGLYAVFPRLAGYATGSVLVYVLLPYVLFRIFLAVRAQVRFMRNRRRRGVPAR